MYLHTVSFSYVEKSSVATYAKIPQEDSPIVDCYYNIFLFDSEFNKKYSGNPTGVYASRFCKVVSFIYLLNTTFCGLYF